MMSKDMQIDVDQHKKKIAKLKKKLRRSIYVKVDREFSQENFRSERRNPRSSACLIDFQDLPLFKRPSVLDHLDEIKLKTRNYEEGQEQLRLMNSQSKNKSSKSFGFKRSSKKSKGRKSARSSKQLSKKKTKSDGQGLVRANSRKHTSASHKASSRGVRK